MAELTVDAAAMAAMAAAPLASMPEEAALQHMYAAPLMQSALQPNHLTANARRKPAKFVVQLYKMICEDPDLVRWHSGNIIMPNPTALKLKARGRARARARAPRSDARRRNRAPCTSVRSQQHTPARRLSRLRSSRTTSSTRTSRRSSAS